MSISPVKAATPPPPPESSQKSLPAELIKRSSQAEIEFAEEIRSATVPSVPKDPDRGQNLDIQA